MNVSFIENILNVPLWKKRLLCVYLIIALQVIGAYIYVSTLSSGINIYLILYTSCKMC